MLFEDSRDFRKTLKRLPVDIQDDVFEALEHLADADTFSDIPHLKSMKGYPNFYRIRIRSYRIGMFWTGNRFLIQTIGPRGDFYKHFP
jgi:mRNA-degrading endonuclease RelE of RelBE toxin-antitoxin system